MTEARGESAATDTFASIKCGGCDVMFVPQHKSRRYHDEKCRKKSENRRRRGPSFTERVIAIKGRRCTVCGSEREGRRTAFCWEGEKGRIDRAAVLCPRCLKGAHRWNAGQVELFDGCDTYAEQDAKERKEQEEGGYSILDAEDAGVVDTQPLVINRSNLDEASRDTHPRELFCHHCEARLCQVSPDDDVIAVDNREVLCKDGAVACSWCRERGREKWTKISEALPDTITHGPTLAPWALKKVERLPRNGRTLAEMLHDLGIERIATQIPPQPTVPIEREKP